MIRTLLARPALPPRCSPPAPGAQTAAQSPYGKAERRDPIFLRFNQMADRYWVNTETMAASHKVVAVPMPRQCAFLYADSYSRGQMSESEVQQVALSNCNRRLAELGPLGENYSVNCQCKVVISDERLRRAARHAARRFLRSDLDLLSRRSRQRCAPERRGPLRRPDRARPLGHLLRRERARRAGLRRHLHQRRAEQRQVLAVVLRRQVQRQRQLRKQDGRAQRPHHRPRPDRSRPADRAW